MTMSCTIVLIIAFWICPAQAKRNRIANISPMPKGGSAAIANTESNSKKGKSLKRHGSLNIDEVNSFNFPQITTINASFFELDNTNLIFHWKDSSGTGQMNGVDSHWYGEVADGIGSMTLIKSFENNANGQISRLSGFASMGGNLYSIMASVDGSVFVNMINATDFPPERDDDSMTINSPSHAEKRQLSLRGSIRESSESRNLDDGSVLDVLCMYTLQTVCQEAILGGFLAADTCNTTTYKKYKYLMDAKCQLAVAQSNTAYTLSGVKTKLNLLHSDSLDPNFKEDASWDNTVNNIMDKNNAMFQPLISMRESYAADLVAVILNNNNMCGSGYGAGYFFVNQDCMVGYYSFAHEIGHIMGCVHEAAQYTKPSGSMYGYTDPTNGFRTIMAIDPSLTRIQYFSNSDPTYTYNNMPIGSSTGPVGTSSADCVAMMNSNVYNVANYRQSSKRTTTGNPTRKPTRRRLSPSPTKSRTVGSGGSPSVSRNSTLKPARKPSSIPSNPLPTCISQSSCSQGQVSMILRLDRPQDLSWSVFDPLTNQIFCSDGPYPTSSISPQTYCLQSGKNLKLQLRDVGTVGFVKSTSTFYVTVGTSGTNTYKNFTKYNGQSTPFWRGYNFTT